MSNPDHAPAERISPAFSSVRGWFRPQAADSPGQRLIRLLYCLALSALILGPVLGPGYLLVRDAVSTPRSYITDSALGLSDSPARAVPQDAAIAALSSLLDGGLVVKLILLASLTAGGIGAAALARRVLGAGMGPQLLAATVLLWNPYVAERLLQGHWSLLAGYAALPWAALAASAIRRRRRGSWPALALCAAAAGLTPTGLVLCAVVVLCVFAGSPSFCAKSSPSLRAKSSPSFCANSSPSFCAKSQNRQIPTTTALRGWLAQLAGIVAIVVTAASPWLAATAFGGGAASDPAGVAAFSARAEPWLGTLGSLAGLGGIWNSQAVPASRSTPFAVVGTLVLLGLVVTGCCRVWRAGVVRAPRLFWVLGGLAGATLIVVALAATPPGLSAVRWLVEVVPGAGLLRDSQKWMALAAPFCALAAAAAVADVDSATTRAMTGKFAGSAKFAGSGAAGRAGLLSAVAIAAVVLVLPDLAWGAFGRLAPVHYSPEWRPVAQLVRANPGDVAVLPAGMFRVRDGRQFLDPASRMLPADVLQTGVLVVGGQEVGGENARAGRVEALLLGGSDPESLAREGVRWVLVEREDAGPMGDSARTLDQLDEVWGGADLALYHVDGDVAAQQPQPGARATVIAAHWLWAALLAVGLGGLLLQRARPGASSRSDAPASS